LSVLLESLLRYSEFSVDMQFRAVCFIVCSCSLSLISAGSSLVAQPHQLAAQSLTVGTSASSGADGKRTEASDRLVKSADIAIHQDFVLSSDVELVLLDVSVKDSRGGFASGLFKDHFKVQENGKQQKISIFSSEDVPVTVGLVIDHSGSVRPKRPEVITAALSLVQKSNPKDELFLVNFSDRVWLGLPEGIDFTDDVQLLRRSMLSARMAGRTALYDGLKRALEHAAKGKREKKTLILISDGGDNSSETTKSGILRLAQESLVTIYAVGIFGPSERDKNPGFLKKLASITGGESFMPDDISELPDVCEKIAHDIRNRYTIGYVPDDRNFDGSLRHLKVTAFAADRGKLKVRTRTHYIAAGVEKNASRNQRHR
jgi:VWFA-related protein